ncbi:MAG TPA: glycoside hydrolase family 2 TIM barrel-domain containing protein [Acidobacteriaceae bacterium]
MSSRHLFASVGNAFGGRLPWDRKKSPLMTRWSDAVDPAHPLPEYPRPQFARNEWLNLNSIWEFQPGKDSGESAPICKSLSNSILVPYPVESALSGVMEHYDRLWYRCSFSVPKKWESRQVLLHFGAVDYESEVFVNGQSVGLHRGGYDPFSFDISAQLKPDSQNELIVRVFDPTEAGGQPRGKQNTSPRGITYTPTTGIWQTVWLEPVHRTHISSFSVVPDIDQEVVHLQFYLSEDAHDVELEVIIHSGSEMIQRSSAHANRPITLPMRKPKLWSPTTPHLYSLQLRLKQSAKLVDSVNSYFAMRKTSIGDVDGHKKLLLNNDFVFQLGPLDQGFWPDGIYTAPTDEALKSNIVQMKAMGFNMVRKHIKVEPARWYYWADQLGLMVWQDAPSCNSYPGRAFIPPPVDKVAFEEDLRHMIVALRNNPSIVLWTVFNEGQGQFDTERLVSLVRSLDPSRPVNEASGGEIKGSGDIDDIHSYPEPAVRPENHRQANVCGEFGGIGYLIPDRSWQPNGHGYVEAATPEDLLYLYAKYIAKVRDLREGNNLSAAVYTELTDVMTEVNGLLTYDRIPKVALDQIRRVNEFRFPAPAYSTILPSSEDTAQPWKYTFEKPTDDWQKKDFDDSGWLKGNGAFGNHGTDAHIEWSTPDIWLRREFHVGKISAKEVNRLVMNELHRSRLDVYVNGIQNYTQQGNNRSGKGFYEHRPLNRAVREAVLPGGQNVIAVHCHAVSDLQFFDAGLAVRIPTA